VKNIALIFFAFILVTSSQAQINTFPYNQDFETMTNCAGACTGACPLTMAWVNATGDDIDWKVDDFGTGSANTGPTASGGADHNPGISGGNYLYTETSGCTFDTAWLLSPQVDLVGVALPQLEFWYHMFGATMGTLHVDVTTDNGTSWLLDVVPSVTANLDAWQQQIVNLNPYVGDTIRVRIRGVTGSSFTSDMAVDDFTFSVDTSNLDIGIDSILPICSNTSDLLVSLTNFGTGIMDTTFISASLNGAPIYGPTLYLGPLLGGQDTTLNLGPITANVGDTLLVWTANSIGLGGAPDTTLTNDTAFALIAFVPPPVANAGLDTTICAQDTVAIGGSPTGPPGATYVWTPVGTLSSGTVANPSAAPITSTQYIVTVTDLNGCIGMDTVVVTTNPLPVANAGGNQSICFGDSITIGGNPTGPPAVTYLWSPAATLDSSNVANPVAFPTITTQYSVTVTDTIGCSDVELVTITVNPLPVADAGPDTSICTGDTFALGGIPTGPAGSTYNWSGAGLLSTGANPQAAPAAVTTYFVTVTDGNGCIDTDSIVVSLDTIPIPVVNAPGPVCNGDSVSLVASGGTVYLWSPGGTLSNAQAATTFAFPATTTTYSVTVTDANQCSDTTSVVVSIFALPAVDAGPNESICPTDSVQLGASGAVNYVWTPNVAISNTTIADPFVYPLSSVTYTVVGTDANSCSNSDTVLVAVNAVPLADAGTNQNVCFGDSVQIGGSPSGPGGATYAWTPSVTIGDPTAANPFVIPTIDTTEYQVIVTDVNNCSDTSYVTVFRDSLPVAMIIGNSLICELWDTTQLTASGGISYSWTPTDGISNPNIDMPLVFVDTSTVYTVLVTDTNGCMDDTTIAITVLPAPMANAGQDTSFCIGDTVILSASGGTQYFWNTTDSLSDSTIANPTVNPLVSQTYTVSVYDGSNGCGNEDAVLVTVNPLPIVSAGDDKTICFGDVVTIGGTPTGPGGSTYQWTPVDSLNSTTTANPSGDPRAASTVYTVLVTDINDCMNMDSMQVTVNPLPIVTASANRLGVCLEDTATLTATGAVDYLWLPTLGLNAVDSNLVLASPLDTTTYTVTGTDLNGCFAQASVTIDIWKLPSVAINDDSTICFGESSNLSVTDDPTYTYVWTPGASLSDSTASSPLATPGVTTNYSVLIVDTFLCENRGSAQVLVNPLPVIDAGFDIKNCEGSTIELGGNPSGPSGAFYSWTPFEGLSDRNDPNPRITSLENSVYTLEVIDFNGCRNTDNIAVAGDCFTNIYVPNAFTPNGDGINDRFEIKGYRINSFELFIYDRWGQLIFKSFELSNAWDGQYMDRSKIAPPGTYTWLLRYVQADGRDNATKGTVTLVR